jgi:hypothetical protein
MAEGRVTHVNEERATRSFENRSVKSLVSKRLNVISISSSPMSSVVIDQNSCVLENISRLHYTRRITNNCPSQQLNEFTFQENKI